MGNYEFSVHVAAPQERVFNAWINLDRIGEWVEGVTRVSDVSGPLDRPETIYTLWFGRMRGTVEVLAVERPRLFRTRSTNVILKIENEARFEPDGDGTRISQTFRTIGLVSRLFARLFATGSYKGSFRGELNTFKRLVEAEGA